jgi:hypothetical protein
MLSSFVADLNRITKKQINSQTIRGCGMKDVAIDKSDNK